MKRAVCVWAALLAGGCGGSGTEPIPIEDNFVVVGTGEAAEIVDIESDGSVAVLCGGFGGKAFDLRDPRAPKLLGPIGGRCQRAAFGATTTAGDRVVYVTHHGDTRWWPPYLRTYHVGDAGIELVDAQPDEAVLYEGMAWKDDVLYVAAHAGGLRIYSTEIDGVPSFVSAVDGFDNAWKVAVEDAYAYVADRNGVHVLDRSDPLAPVRVTVIDTPGQVLDVHVHDQRLYLALGSAGAEVYDVSNPAAPRLLTRLGSRGSTQAVAANDRHIALANWTHFELVDATTFETLATDSPVGPLEQDMAVALLPDLVLAVEWGTGLHVLEHRPGAVAPDLWVDDGFFSFRGDRIEARAVVVRNLGDVELEIDSIEVTDPGIFAVDASSLSIAPGQAAAFELTYTPAAAIGFDSFVSMRSNDPDRAELRLPLRVGEERDIKVGDVLDERFDFLDPNGTNQVEGLDGKVVLLAYFGVW